jgi:pimeloyl-ACP methyl ester carboxylesterase
VKLGPIGARRVSTGFSFVRQRSGKCFIFRYLRRFQQAEKAARHQVVWTSHDPTATPEEGKQIADMIPGSKFVVMNRCGHWPQFEDAEQFNRLHIEFLQTGK